MLQKITKNLCISFIRIRKRSKIKTSLSPEVTILEVKPKNIVKAKACVGDKLSKYLLFVKPFLDRPSGYENYEHNN